jgi:hypothetical protein
LNVKPHRGGQKIYIPPGRVCDIVSPSQPILEIMKIFSIALSIERESLSAKVLRLDFRNRLFPKNPGVTHA